MAIAAEAAHGLAEPMVLTGRAENHIRGVDDLDDTIARLIAYRDAGADCVYAPGLTDIEEIKRVVGAVGIPVNVLALATAPPIPQLAAAGVRRVSTGSLLAGAAYGALHTAAQELLDAGTSNYAERHIPRDVLHDALGCRAQPPVEEKCIQSLTLVQSPPQPQPMALNARTTAGVTIPLRSGVRLM